MCSGTLPPNYDQGFIVDEETDPAISSALCCSQREMQAAAIEKLDQAYALASAICSTTTLDRPGPGRGEHDVEHRQPILNWS